MSYTEAQLRDLLHQAGHLPYGPGQIALVEQVITHADALRLPSIAFAARMRGTEAYFYGGEAVRAFPTFAWCLAEFDRDPAAFAEHQSDLLWHFKHMVSAMTSFPEIPLDRTYAVLDDMQRRWTESGHSLHAVYAYRHHVAAHVGNVEAAQEYYVRWCAAPRDHLSDCAGCDPTSKASWLADRGQDEEAIAIGEAVLNGPLDCSDQPRGMLTTLTFPYLRTGRLDQARDAHRRAYRLYRASLAALGSIADHVEFCARTGNEARAVEMVERHLGWLDRAPSPWAAMVFAASAAHALRRAQQRHTGELMLHRPEHGDRPAGTVAAVDLAAELAAQATDLGSRFDQRNGTPRVGELVAGMLDAEPLVEYLQLSPTAAGPSTVVRAVEDLPAPPVAAPPPMPVEVPVTAGPDDLLDLIGEHHDTNERARASAALDAFESRYGDRELTTHQRARLADARAFGAWLSDDADAAIDMWRTASADYAASTDRDREQRAWARIGNLLCWAGRAEEGLPIIRSATDRLLTSPDPGMRVDAVLRLSHCYGYLDDYRSALDALEHTALRPDDAPVSLRARHAARLAYCHLRLERLADLMRVAPRAIALAEQAGDADLLSSGHATFAGVLFANDRDREALQHIDAAIAQRADNETRAALIRVRAQMLAHTEQAAAAIDDLIEGIADCTARGDQAKAADLRHDLAVAYLNTGRLLDAAEVADEELAFRIADQHSLDDASHITAGVLLATIYQRLGQPTEAVAQLDALADDAAQRGIRITVGGLAQRAGEILHGANLYEEAAARFLAAANAFAELGQSVRELHNRRRQAETLRTARRFDQAVAAITAADAVAARATGSDDRIRWELAALDYSAARILWATGHRTDAAQRAERAARASTTFDAPVFTAESHLILGGILLNTGRPAEAEEAIRQALAVLPDGVDRQPYEQVLEAARAAQQTDSSEESL